MFFKICLAEVNLNTLKVDYLVLSWPVGQNYVGLTFSSCPWNDVENTLCVFIAHSPDNTFLGFVSGVKVNASESKRILAKKRNQCLVYGRVLEYWRVSIVELARETVAVP